MKFFAGLILAVVAVATMAQAHAATPVPLPATTTLVCAEGCTVKSTTGTAVAYYFGAGTTYNLVPSLTLPALINCVSATAPACTNLGGDPIAGVAKSIYAVQQAAGYTVTYTAAGSTTPVVVSVPALPVTVVKQWSCIANSAVMFNLMSDGSFQVNGPITCKELL